MLTTLGVSGAARLVHEKSSVAPIRSRALLLNPENENLHVAAHLKYGTARGY